MHSLVQELGNFGAWEEVLACRLDEVLAGWLSPGDLFEPPPPLPSTRKRAVQAPEAAWGAIKTVMQLMQDPVLREACGKPLPREASAPASSTTTGLPPGHAERATIARRAMDVAGPLARVQPCDGGGVLERGGAARPLAQKNALGCLRILVSRLGEGVWDATVSWYQCCQQTPRKARGLVSSRVAVCG